MTNDQLVLRHWSLIGPWDLVIGASYALYMSIGGHAHIKLRSPYGLSILPTAGQNFLSFTHGAGNAASLLRYLWGHSSDMSDCAVCGAPRSKLSVLSAWPSSMARISSLMRISASQKRSSSSFGSDSVGSIMSVP